MRLWWGLLACLATEAAAETVIATRTIRSQTVIQPGDLTYASGTVVGALDNVDQAIGLETRIALYAGRPVRAGDLGPPALVERNAVVTLVYTKGALRITAEGRALGRGAVGEVIRVMNLDSRNTLTGIIAENGTVLIGG